MMDAAAGFIVKDTPKAKYTREENKTSGLIVSERILHAPLT